MNGKGWARKTWMWFSLILCNQWQFGGPGTTRVNEKQIRKMVSLEPALWGLGERASGEGWEGDNRFRCFVLKSNKARSPVKKSVLPSSYISGTVPVNPYTPARKRRYTKIISWLGGKNSTCLLKANVFGYTWI